ncbi:HIT domain-containing protein [Salinibius halmophilus]|uniref:HIT domain-containing protein n=1 Tax=Salinibius halmophilus TaxID=1853216 RepID=UPI000E671BEE|nr:HIT domain-containing protein [Salinibius halmophilus]
MFELDYRLESDCREIGRLVLCRVLLMKDANYPWVILVPQREGVEEIYQLDALDQEQLIWESSFVSKKMSQHFKADKMNVAALGNVVSQLHIHHVARKQTDPAWPSPIWGKVPVQGYLKEQLEQRVAALQQVFATSCFVPAD